MGPPHRPLVLQAGAWYVRLNSVEPYVGENLMLHTSIGSELVSAAERVISVYAGCGIEDILVGFGPVPRGKASDARIAVALRPLEADTSMMPVVRLAVL
jgi:hypothetical protein